MMATFLAPDAVYGPACSFVPMDGGAHLPADFLRIINDGTADYPLRRHHQYRFTQNVGLVILGPCSRLPWNVIASQFAVTFPALRVYSGKVLLVCHCCGPYTPMTEDDLKRFFPRVEWIIPHVGDFQSNARSDELSLSLVQAGVLIDDE